MDSRYQQNQYFPPIFIPSSSSSVSQSTIFNYSEQSSPPMASSLLLPLILLSLLPLFSSLSPDPILDASHILKDSGFFSMSLILDLASRSFLHHFSSLTIFAPPDSAFSRSGQPPLSLLQYHLLPHAFSAESLRSLPLNAKISTMLPSRFLTVTNDETRISLNNVTVDSPPVYDDGSLIIFGIEKLFNPFFDISNASSKRIMHPDNECRRRGDSEIESKPVEALAAALRNRGWTVMGSFLDLQILGFHKEAAVTIFAPTDDSLMNRVSNFSDWMSMFRRHVVPCKLWWSDLTNLGGGAEIKTYLRGFVINVKRSNGVLTLNDVSVIYPDMLYSEGIVVHGIGGILDIEMEMKGEIEESPSSSMRNGGSPESGFEENDGDTAVTHYHFSVIR
ncbi:putative fasciclin-like arabinogalactan protein 20 [Cucumis sativus]|uniref:FAS1 domain-containing protein n=1 Tax=Cucumis sativus TaxID=3659 RepID=A0A0A0KSZ5_CUCSA|nr:putative fasciclin-like arabinogalactan protein 20 [Cucumis sativus]KGN51507.1 hypothetical protein Csa_007973 [Cucumis sativus]